MIKNKFVVCDCKYRYTICNICVLQILVHICTICVLHGTVQNGYNLFALLLKHSDSYYCFCCCCCCHYWWHNLWQKCPNMMPLPSNTVPLYFFLIFLLYKHLLFKHKCTYSNFTYFLIHQKGSQWQAGWKLTKQHLLPFSYPSNPWEN